MVSRLAQICVCVCASVVAGVKPVRLPGRLAEEASQRSPQPRDVGVAALRVCLTRTPRHATAHSLVQGCRPRHLLQSRCAFLVRTQLLRPTPRDSRLTAAPRFDSHPFCAGSQSVTHFFKKGKTVAQVCACFEHRLCRECGLCAVELWDPEALVISRYLTEGRARTGQFRVCVPRAPMWMYSLDCQVDR